MKLGIIANPEEPSFAMAKEKKLSFLEFCINIGQDCNQFHGRIEELKAYIQKYGVDVGSIGRWGTDKIDSNGNIIEEELQNSYLLIDAAQQLGCKVFNTGVNYVKNLSYYQNITAAISFLQKLVDYGKEKNVKIATYNCRWNNYICTGEVWKLVHGHIQELGIKFDSSHCIYDGGNYLSEMKNWGNRFYHVHIKGSLRIDGERFDDPPAGLDSTDWGAFMGVLYGVKYDGLLSIEPHSNTWKDELGEKGVDFTIQYMSKYIL